ncbi:hypothetical protein pEp_SNUABM10_00002 [Erwinia phage pEp_SNUABM_10]|nr:hypothetical protein pEp_SNUABM03_00051 [Erwinia phage pEp_SNUABM_03]QOC57706.1 hypothetical protein pEp_SNUABM10_00002 [Erwinia phage pEp_SNUABM_10]
MIYYGLFQSDLALARERIRKGIWTFRDAQAWLGMLYEQRKGFIA